MLFSSLFESMEHGELLLVDGGMCQWHLRRDRKLVIRIIISTKSGAGTKMLEILKKIKGISGIFLKCPVDYESNNWYKKKGFELVSTIDRLNEWWLPV